MQRTLLGCLLATFATLGLVSETAFAQKNFNAAAARAHYVAAKQAESKKDWKEAAKEYGVAYDISREAVLFYNIGFALMSDGNCEFAIIYFERFLKEASPKVATKKKTEGYIAKCKKDLGIVDKPEDELGPDGTGGTTGGAIGGTSAGNTAAGIDPLTGLPVGYKDPSASQTSTAVKGAWVALGLATAFGATGTVFALTARDREQDIRDLLNYRNNVGSPGRFEGALAERYQDKVDEGDRYELLSYLAFGAAAASTVTALALFAIDALGDKTEEPIPKPGATPTTAIAPTANGRGVSVTAQWDF